MIFDANIIMKYFNSTKIDFLLININFFLQDLRSGDGTWVRSNSRDHRDMSTSPVNERTGTGYTNMTNASTMRTAAMQTKDALFSSKRRGGYQHPHQRSFPNLAQYCDGKVVGVPVAEVEAAVAVAAAAIEWNQNHQADFIPESKAGVQSSVSSTSKRKLKNIFAYLFA